MDYKKDFPILNQKIKGKRLTYLDNGATTQKPIAVIKAVEDFYKLQNSNVHRGVHYLSQLSTRLYEEARVKIQKFIHAQSEKEIIFTKGTTESINLVAQTWGRKNLNSESEVLISQMEHHSNIVPWQMICDQTGAKLKVIPIFESGELDLEAFEKLLNPKTKLVSVVHVSNSLGTINPISKIINMAHKVGAKVLIDGAQSIQHLPIDVQSLDCDFFAFSGHKIYGPTGIGVLYGKKSLLQDMPPYQGGGDMIRTVSFEKTTYNDLPYKFEAGTPNIEGVIGLGAAIDYVLSIGLSEIQKKEAELFKIATRKISDLPGVKIVGTAKEKCSVISFTIDGIHPHDIGTIVDQEGVAIRAGHHCTQPVMDFYKVPATARASLSFYNDEEDIQQLILAIKKTQEIFK